MQADTPTDHRNATPHKAAVAAMWLFGARYAAQRGGAMDFWDGLSESDKRLCQTLVSDVENAPSEENHG